MRRISSTLTAVFAATLLTASTAAAQGVLADRETHVTFSGPVSLPGTTLPAGTYVFRLADSPANRNIVQIFEKDRSKLITTVLAVAAERNQAEGDPVVSFKETPSDRPPAVRYWYYAGEKAGNEFIYPKAQAMMIASASGETVTAFDTDATDLDAWKKGGVTKVSPTTTTEQASTASTTSASTASTTSTTSTATTTTAPEPKPEPAPTTSTATTTGTMTGTTGTMTGTTGTSTGTSTATTTTAAPTPEPTPAPATAPVTTEPTPAPVTTAPSTVEPSPVGTSGRTELPATGSQLPMVGLIGLVAFAAALGVRAARRSIV
jgi:hypothetical protein